MGYVSVQNSADGPVLVSGKDKRPFHGDPLAQVSRNASNVQRALVDVAGGPVHRILCVAPAPNREVLVHDDGQGTPIRICTAKTLAAALADLAPTVAPDQARAAERALKTASRRNKR